MDIPTYIIFSSFIISIIFILCLKFFRVIGERLIKFLFVYFSVLWIFITLFGEFTYTWAGNAICSKYLGCVVGFLGYDAFEHFFFGVALALGIIWLCKHFPKYSILHPVQWKKVLIVVAIVVLAGVIWEILECSYDALRVDIFHEPIYNLTLHINLLTQPTNLDTMGDLSTGFLGSIIGLFLLL